MKTMILLLATLISLAGCREDGSEIKQETEQETTIYGTWQLTSTFDFYGLSGHDWSRIEDGYIYQINADHTFMLSEFSEWSTGIISPTGIISLTSDEITFYYDTCEDRKNSMCGVKFVYELVNNYELILGMECDEICENRFTKIVNEQRNK